MPEPSDTHLPSAVIMLTALVGLVQLADTDLPIGTHTCISNVTCCLSYEAGAYRIEPPVEYRSCVHTYEPVGEMSDDRSYVFPPNVPEHAMADAAGDVGGRGWGWGGGWGGG